MSTAVLSIGSNVGDRIGLLRGAVAAMRPWLTAASPVYETAPWGPVAQQDFLNAVLLVADPDAGPYQWLDRAQDAELAAGRTREVHWGPRTLDVDVIAVDDVDSDDPRLLLPHPRAHERAFVLVPWLVVQPGASLHGRPAREWLEALPDDDVRGVRERRDLVLDGR